MHQGKGIYRIYRPSDDSREVDKCHRNRTAVYNALLPCQTLPRNTHTIKGLTLDNGLHMSKTQWRAKKEKSMLTAEPLDEILSQLREQIWSGSNSAFVHVPPSESAKGRPRQTRFLGMGDTIIFERYQY